MWSLFDSYWPLTSLNIFILHKIKMSSGSIADNINTDWGKRRWYVWLFFILPEKEALLLKLTAVEEMLQVLIAALASVLINSLCGVHWMCCGVCLVKVSDLGTTAFSHNWRLHIRPSLHKIQLRQLALDFKSNKHIFISFVFCDCKNIEHVNAISLGMLRWFHNQ